MARIAKSCPRTSHWLSKGQVVFTKDVTIATVTIAIVTAFTITTIKKKIVLS